MRSIEDSIHIVRERIANACARAGRREDEVKLIAVTKRVDSERIQAAVAHGLRDFGENYLQEAMNKIEVLGEDICWHMIGNIQMNKLKHVARLFDYVHSVDRWEVLDALDKYGKDINVLFEVNLSKEMRKHGMVEDDLSGILEKASLLRFSKPVGLMTMAPFLENPEEARHIFVKLRELLGRVNKEFSLNMEELSMGMSSDFEVAIEEGATMVRIGTAIFGERA